jgi:hypothetical protein
MLGILAAVLLATAPQNDTVYLADGGRLVGTVVEESAESITVQLPDGTTRRLAPREVTRIDYADGSVSTPNRPPPPPPTYRRPPPPPPPYPPPAYRPPPAYAGPPPAYRPPPPVAEPAQAGMPAVFPLWGSFGLGGAILSGEVEDGIPIDERFDSQLDVWLEGGVRLTPHLGLGMYVDIGVGEPSREVRVLCDTPDAHCTATTGRVGILLRHTFEPRARSTPWLAVGTGYEFGSVDVNDDLGHGSTELFSYSGWEMLRLMVGVDLRSNPVFGVGLYGGVAFGAYNRYEDALVSERLDDRSFHTTIQGGVRFTLFP